MNLGQMLLNRGQAEEALAYCQEAVGIEPTMAELHDNLGIAYGAAQSARRGVGSP